MNAKRLGNRKTSKAVFELTLAVVGLLLMMASATAWAQDESAASAKQETTEQEADTEHENGPSENDVEAAVKKLSQMQEQINKILPVIEAATVCMESGGGSGSGIIISEDGLILSAAHVTAPHTEMTVKFQDGTTVKCKCLGAHGPSDASMAQIIDEGKYPFVPVAKEVVVGETIISTGHPSGFDAQRGIPLRIGHVIKKGAADSAVQYSTDAPLIGGDSGGPAFNLKGEVVGIHSNISDNANENNDVDIAAFHQNWEQMKSGKTVAGSFTDGKGDSEDGGKSSKPDRIVFGLFVFSNAAGESVRVQKVSKGTPADWAGLKKDDLIKEVNGESPGRSNRFIQNVVKEEFGREFTLLVQRSEQELELNVTLLTQSELKEERQRRAGKPNGEKASEDYESESETDNVSSTSVDRTCFSRNSARFRHKPVRQSDGLQATNITANILQEQTKQENQKPDTQSEERPKSELQRLLKESRSNNGQLEIERNKLREFQKQLSKRMDSHSPIGGRELTEWGKTFNTAFSRWFAKYSESVLPIYVGGRQSVNAVVIDPAGYLLTKASEVEGRKAQVEIGDQQKIEAQFVAFDREADLAILKIDINRLTEPLVAIDFSSHANAPNANPNKGSLCCCVGRLKDRSVGFGVVCVGARALNGNTSAYLGVIDPQKVEGGVRLSSLSPGGPAARAGMQSMDVVESVDGKEFENVKGFTDLIESYLPHERVKLSIRRGDRWLTLPVQLGDKSKVASMPGATEQATDAMSTSMSRRRWNFTEGIQHDCGIQPKNCGTLLIDLKGNIIGFNIARAGRIKSYAIPSSLVAKFVTDTMSQRESQEVFESNPKAVSEAEANAKEVVDQNEGSNE